MVWIPYLSLASLAHRGDTFSHPSGSSAWLRPISLTSISNRKEWGRDCSRSPTPSGSVFLVHCLFITATPLLASRSDTGLAPNPGSPRGSRKRSVPGRVHSIPKSCGSQTAAALPRSNPLLTHGTVESPAKLFFAVSKEQRATAPNQALGLGCPTPFLVGGGSQKSFRLHC